MAKAGSAESKPVPETSSAAAMKEISLSNPRINHPPPEAYARSIPSTTPYPEAAIRVTSEAM
ncbi:MAG: hypothetical protein J6X25_05735 [Bacteroidales bacterium]|nr:hypothetical protein [Bacteroidales bacterium]